MKSCILNGQSSFAGLGNTPGVMVMIYSTDRILHLHDMSFLLFTLACGARKRDLFGSNSASARHVCPSLYAGSSSGHGHVSEDLAAPPFRRASNFQISPFGPFSSRLTIHTSRSRTYQPWYYYYLSPSINNTMLQDLLPSLQAIPPNQKWELPNPAIEYQYIHENSNLPG